jgi:hypothetical protein
VSSYVQVGPALSAVLSEDSRAFTEIARDLADRMPRLHLIALPDVERADFVDDAFSYSSLYRRWGRFLGEFAAGLLVGRGHPSVEHP